LIKDETRIYIRDCYDHTIQVIDMLENLREISSGLVDLYHSNIGNRMNEIMKVLTLIATIFIPLSFIAGLYGMNFDTEKSPWNLPELGWYFGYPLALLLMLVIAGAQLYFFKRKGWIGSTYKRESDRNQ
jgi:magnesium transporter